jgi:hypothetical protein
MSARKKKYGMAFGLWHRVGAVMAPPLCAQAAVQALGNMDLLEKIRSVQN